MFKNELGLCIVMTMTDSDIMKKKLETIEGMASVQQTAKKMRSIWIMHFYFRFSFYEVFMSQSASDSPRPYRRPSLSLQ
jgi:hypothetical protein